MVLVFWSLIINGRIFLALCCCNTRCYTSLEPSHSASVQCGHGYSCLKISKPPEVFNMFGEFVPPDQRPGDVALFRGCFVLDVLKVRLMDIPDHTELALLVLKLEGKTY